ncbi:hypothetical protein BD413DRAFT_610674 [Trametes elegans]|nr:hypothetical protein BD413DRAFT_610674 [Trametes elegans]
MAMGAVEQASVPPPSPVTPPPFRVKRVELRPEEVDISPHGRTKSILLDRAAVRLIYKHARYHPSKSLAPLVYVSKPRWRAKQLQGRAPLDDAPRQMTEEERSLYANPYLRILGSPLRECFQTGWLLPRELLIRMAPMLLPTAPHEKRKCAFLPDGLEHPSSRPVKGGQSHYLLCYSPVLDLVRERGGYKRFTPEGVGLMTMHPLVTHQVGHLLRVRVLHELQLLARRLLHRRHLAKPDEPPLLRRLTRAEWKEIRTTGVVPFKNAVAVLIVPPPNRSVETGTRPTPYVATTPNPDALRAGDLPKSLPLSVLHPTAEDEWWPEDEDLPGSVPPARVPLYNGVTLFPAPTQRAALHRALGEVLQAERTSRLVTNSAASEGAPRSAWTPAKGDQKASHAILVCSDEKTLLRADTVPLAIALWRIRLWEGDAIPGDGQHVDWMADPPSKA